MFGGAKVVLYRGKKGKHMVVGEEWSVGAISDALGGSG